MTEKYESNQYTERRSPRQARSQLKVELMLEAAIQLLDQGEITALTTNAVAAKAGVSIGTLYQYFKDKQALLDALVARELGSMSEQVMAALQRATPDQPGARIRQVVRTVTSAYGGRSRVHRLLMEYELTQGTSGRTSPMLQGLTQFFTTQGVSAPGLPSRQLTLAQAFTLTHAIGGVLRALAASAEPPPVQEVEDAVVQMALAYVAAMPKE